LNHILFNTHCDMWLYLHNSVRTDAMNRPLRLRNVRCGLSTYTNIYPRTPIVIRDCIYIIRVNGRDESAPTPTECMLRIVHVHPLRGRFIVPAYHGMYGVDILCFICFVFHCAIVYLCALMIFFFRSVAPTHVATTLN